MSANSRYLGCIKEKFRLLVRSIDPTEQLLTELSFSEGCQLVEELLLHRLGAESIKKTTMTDELPMAASAQTSSKVVG